MYTELSRDYEKVVTIDNPIYQSFQGRYFLGQSELITFGHDTYAFGSLYNPIHSGVNLFISVSTITNTSKIAFKSRPYMNARIPSGGSIVENITPANLVTIPQPVSKIKFITGQFKEPIQGGVKAYTRMIPAESTLANEKDGKFVIPPGSNFMLVLVPPTDTDIQADIAYGFWTEKYTCKL
ncbi:DUF6143 family protein [Anaeromicropila herbilytica]|uniref:Uncharacterized protein n=1 Tax=Anaeromicropila herbilytica TaxID=2785025 RepID=A0A7R7ID29_9FIRM|nr:DUF6143 family protein [Anaeromicropila herbilytica]BCN29603.1 hypothetical protein bsdtb5_08980 [Anaeromicropila herbilytica]